MVRCKFRCTQKSEVETGYVITLVPVNRGTEENEKFFRYTPFGKMEFGTVNSDAAKQFEVGKEYFIDFTKCE